MSLTKYEKARLLGARALQISMGAPLHVQLSPSEFEAVHYSPLEIAKIEFKKGVLPLTVKRPMPAKADA